MSIYNRYNVWSESDVESRFARSIEASSSQEAAEIFANDDYWEEPWGEDRSRIFIVQSAEAMKTKRIEVSVELEPQFEGIELQD